jgi:hypothetical protein
MDKNLCTHAYKHKINKKNDEEASLPLPEMLGKGPGNLCTQAYRNTMKMNSTSVETYATKHRNHPTSSKSQFQKPMLAKNPR